MTDPRYEELLHYLETPQYGPVRPISGKYMLGRETSIIGICDKPRDTCTPSTNVDGSEQPCWIVFNDRSSSDLKRLAGRAYGQDGEYWISGTGRIAVRPGEFGHLGGETCQVEMATVDAFEVGPPYFWVPPPPAK